jgi:hypothetical protein
MSDIENQDNTQVEHDEADDIAEGILADSLPSGTSNDKVATQTTQSPSKGNLPLLTPLTQTGNATLDAGLAAIQAKAGITQADFDRATAKAVQYGDIDLIDKAFLAEKFGADAVQIEALSKAMITERVANVERGKQAAYAVVGGEANWQAVATQFKAIAPASLQTAMRNALDANPAEGAAAILQYVQAMAGNTGLTGHESRNLTGGRLPLQSGGAGGTPATTGGGITKEQFNQELQGLREKYPNQSLEGKGALATAYKELTSRRTYGRQIGL